MLNNVVLEPSHSKIAFIAHPTDISIFKSYIKYLRSDKSYDERLVMKLFEWSPSYIAHAWDDIKMTDDKKIGGLFIMVPFLPEMKEIRLKQVISKIEGALQIAKSNNCTVAALGAFTSIVLQGKEQEMSHKYGLRLTSGNSFTAALIIEGIRRITDRFNLSLDKCTMTIVGASGDIGSGCVAFFGDKVKKLYLVARSRHVLEETTGRMKQLIKCPFIITSDMDFAIKDSEVVIFVTSAYTQLYDLDKFIPGTIVCDASAPLNVNTSGKIRDDVFLFHGGIAKLPRELDIGFDIGLNSRDHFYGCQTEGILLALDETLPCSWGRGNISREIIEKYLSYVNYPLDVAFSSAEMTYSENDLEMYSRKWNQLLKKRCAAKNF